MQLFFNNKFYESTTAVIPNASKAFRYGELVFETMRVQNKKILFFEMHFERMQIAAALLQFNLPKLFTAPILQKHIEATLAKNNLHTARVRVTIFKGEGGLFEIDNETLNILIETYTLPTQNYELNINGLDLCYYDTMLKTIDAFSNYKTGNHLIYAMAAQYAKQQKCNEAIISNVNNEIADTTISNIFIIKNEKIFTPPLGSGCVAGVFRNYLFYKISSIKEKELSKNDIRTASEIFVTNTIKGIQWVKQINDNTYTNTQVQKLWGKVMQDFI